MKLTRKGEQTRLRILTAAAELIVENGVAGTTMEDVKAAAGASSSQLYHYFADKQALVLAVIDYQNDTIVGAQEPIFTQLDTLAGLRTWADYMIDHQRRLQCRGGCPIGALGSELAEIDDEARRAVASGFARWEAGIRGGLAAMHARGELRADPDELALGILATVQGGLLLTQIQRDLRPLESALNLAIAHVTALVS